MDKGEGDIIHTDPKISLLFYHPSSSSGLSFVFCGCRVAF